MYKYCLFYPKYSYVRIRSKFEFARCLNPSLIPSKKGQRERNRIAEAEERREGNRTMPRDKKKKKEKDRTRQKKPIINSVTPWWYASPLTLPPLLFSLSLCSLAPCLSVQKPSKSFLCISIETSERPFSMEFERISGLGTRLGDFSSGEKKAPSNYTWTHVGRSIFSTGWRWGESVAYNVFTRLCPPIPLWSSASIPASTIIFIQRSSLWKSPRSQTLLKHPRHAYACENCFRPFDLSSNVETRLIVSGGVISSPLVSGCRSFASKLGHWKVFFETKDFIWRSFEKRGGKRDI